LAAELVRLPVAVIVTNTGATLAAKAATTTVPIVFAGGGDPVGQGLVTSLNRPGGNVTGVNFLSGVLGAKRLELLRQLVPKATTFALLVNSTSPETEAEKAEVQAAARTSGHPLIIVDVNSDRDIEPVFTDLVRRGVGALIVGPGAFLFSQRQRLAELAARHALPASYAQRETVLVGGLMSYGTSQSAAYRHAASYVSRILKGERPGDLPVMRSTTFEFVINLKTAKTLGLEVPLTLQAIADEVIE
jgi:putative ABC transport system substrate-binding protein